MIFSWAWVIPGIYGRALFSWMCVSLWFLCSYLSLNMSLSASLLRNLSTSPAYQWHFPCFQALMWIYIIFLFFFLRDLRQRRGAFYPFFCYILSFCFQFQLLRLGIWLRVSFSPSHLASSPHEMVTYSERHMMCAGSRVSSPGLESWLCHFPD